MYRTISSGHIWRGNICNRSKSGNLYWVATTIIPKIGADGRIEAYVAYRFDITAEIEARNQMKRLARQDPLVGVLNRIGFNLHLASALRHRIDDSAMIVLVMLDLDNFKEINDIYGHGAGDDVLREITCRITAQCGDHAVISRLGGDEFALILHAKQDAPDLAGRLDDLRHNIEKPMNIGDVQIAIFTSIGYATGVPVLTDAEKLMKEADLALLAAKKAGGHRTVMFAPEMGIAALHRQLLMAEARDALRLGQFRIYYQPVINLHKGGVESCEALLRWHHPERGVLTPQVFSEVFQDFRLATGLGRFLRETVMRDLSRWRAEGVFAGSVAINLIMTDFEGDGLVHELGQLLDAHGLDSSSVILEVTETMFLSSGRAERVRRDLITLAERGFVIAFDDFGTGYASLTHLRELPLNYIKIDRSFVATMRTDERNRQIVIGMIELAHRLNLQVVAEGVEDEAQFHILRHFGCDAIQGYMFSRPVPVDKLPQSARCAAGTLARLVSEPGDM